MQESSARLSYDVAALLNGILWGISGTILISLWFANPREASFQKLLLLYLPIGLFWFAGLAWFLDSIDARLPAKGLISLATVWIISILWPLSVIDPYSTGSIQFYLTMLHLVIIGSLPIIVLDVLLIVYYRIHIAMVIILPIAWGLSGIALTLLLLTGLLIPNRLISIALVGCGYGFMGFVGGGLTLFAVADAKLRHRTASLQTEEARLLTTK
jgi:hypothetical protein